MTKKELLLLIDKLEAKSPGNKMPMLALPYVRDLINLLDEPVEVKAEVKQKSSGSATLEANQ